MNTPKTKKWICEFQSLLYKIGRELTEEEVKSIKYILTPDIGGGSASENAKDMTDVFTLMQQSDILSYQNTKRLVSVLEDVKRVDLAKKLREFERQLHQSKSVPYNIKKARLVTHFKKTHASIQLEDLMQKHTVVTISGPLGAGKSQTAISFGIDLQNKNSDCIVWYCNAKDKVSLLNSLRSLAEEISIHTASPLWSDVNDENAITIIGKELQEQLQGRKVIPFYHLLIIDDVTSECTMTVQNLVESVINSEEPNIKFLVTTRNKYLLKDHEKIGLNGFSLGESLDFLTKGKTIKDERKSQYQKLAEAMSNLPLGLYTARTYMENLSIGPKRFLQLLNTANIYGIESQIREMDLQSTEITLFTAMKFCIYQDLKENMKPEVFEMFRMTQFLENEEIPISLLEFVYRENRNSDESISLMLSDFLVQALQKRSLGIIEGEDENRRLSVHSVIVLTLSFWTTYEEKRCLLRKLIWGFALLLDKDVFHNEDLLRMKHLIPHARAFLRHAEEFNLTEDYDMLVLMTFVYDIVGYGYNYGHFKIISHEYHERSKENCFRLMDCDEASIDVRSKESCNLSEENNIEFYEAFAKKKSEILWKKLDEASRSKEKLLDELVPRFVLQRFRSKLNMEELAKHLDVDISDLRINAETYEKLVNKDLAVSFNGMKLYFLHELLLAVFYTYGRQLFYLGQNPDVKETRKFLPYLYLAKELGQKLSEKQQQLLPLNALLSEITGVLQSRIEDEAQVIQNKLEGLQNTAKRAETLFGMKGKYHIFGIFKMDASVSNHFQTNCLKLVIRCFTTMLNIETDGNRKMEIYEKGCKLADEILQRAKELHDRRDLPGYKVRVAEFFISVENIPPQQVSRAETLFKEHFPEKMLEGDLGNVSLDRHEVKAGYGLVKCYELNGKQETAEKLKSKLKAIDV